MREAAGAQILSQQQVQFLSSCAWPELKLTTLPCPVYQRERGFCCRRVSSRCFLLHGDLNLLVQTVLSVDVNRGFALGRNLAGLVHGGDLLVVTLKLDDPVLPDGLFLLVLDLAGLNLEGFVLLQVIISPVPYHQYTVGYRRFTLPYRW